MALLMLKLTVMFGTLGASSTSVPSVCADAADGTCPNQLNEADAVDTSALLQGRTQVQSKGDCVDDPSFKDIWGTGCKAWAGYDCSKAAATYSSMSKKQQAELIKKCPKSCGICGGGAAPATPIPAPATPPAPAPTPAAGDGDADGDGDGDADGSDDGSDWESQTDNGEYTCAEMRQWYGQEYNEGPCAPKRDDSWADKVPSGMNAIPKKMLGKKCQSSPGESRCDSLGFCDLCGKGNACCKYNDPLVNEKVRPECCLAPEAAFKNYRGETQSLSSRCVFPTKVGADKKCNYAIEKDKIWNSLPGALSGGGGGGAGKTPKKKSPHPAPKVELKGYEKKAGKADATSFPMKADHYLLIGLDSKKWKENCPAFKNKKYNLKADESKGGLYDMSYYHYPVMTSTFPIAEFCGARYTNEVYQEKVDAAAKMAKKACDDMGDLCGGMTVGTDPECCGPAPPEGKPKVGCTEVAFLTSKDKLGDLKLSTNPCSVKTCEYGCNYATYIKK